VRGDPRSRARFPTRPSVTSRFPAPQDEPSSKKKRARGEAACKKNAPTPAIVAATPLPPIDKRAYVLPTRASSFSVPITELIKTCLDFITAPDMSAAQDVHAAMTSYLQRSPDTSQMGLFLLSGRMLEMFSQVVHLRGQVLHVLESKYRIRVENLTMMNLLEEREYKRMDHGTKGMLDLIVNLGDNKEWTAGIFLYEWVSGPLISLWERRVTLSCAGLHPPVPRRVHPWPGD
jgi:hypothetical protein